MLLGLRAAEASTRRVCLDQASLNPLVRLIQNSESRRGLPTRVFVHLCVCGRRDYRPPGTQPCARGGWSQRAERRGFQPWPSPPGGGSIGSLSARTEESEINESSFHYGRNKASVHAPGTRFPPAFCAYWTLAAELGRGRRRRAEDLGRGPRVALAALAVAARGRGQQRPPGEVRGAEA